jgi:site-specific DNA-methyltransferase (adenine-specific)
MITTVVTKTLKRKEIELGFINIPMKHRFELLEGNIAPFETKLNNLSAKVDKQGRLWCCELLKNKLPINSEVELSKNENGFLITINGKRELTDEKAPETLIKEKKQEDASLLIPTSVQDSINHSQKVLEGDCIKYLKDGTIGTVDLTFFDPPYLQGKEYRFFDDNQSDERYWGWIKAIIEGVYKNTSDGGSIYFMHREKNAETILRIIREAGWNFQNLIIWKKKTSAVPIETRFSKQYQIIVYAIKGKRPRVFNKIRIDPPPLPGHKYRHENGVYLTDVWDDIRELTSGYFAGDEALRDDEGKRSHIQQTPVALLLRIILSSSLPGDIVLDPTAGTGTAAVVAKQLCRSSIGIEIDPSHVELINKRLDTLRPSDNISNYQSYYQYTPNLDKIWQVPKTDSTKQKNLI